MVRRMGGRSSHDLMAKSVLLQEGLEVCFGLGRRFSAAVYLFE